MNLHFFLYLQGIYDFLCSICKSHGSHNSMPVTTFHTHCTTEISRRKPLDKGCLWR